MAQVIITRRERFSSAHRLFREDFSREQNEEVYGKCSNPLWHGHNYELFVSVKGKIKAETGFVINMKILSRLVKEKVIEHLDHKNMNEECHFMKGKVSSTENLAVAIWDELAPDIAYYDAQLYCVKVVETENNYVEFFGH